MVSLVGWGWNAEDGRMFDDSWFLDFYGFVIDLLLMFYGFWWIFMDFRSLQMQFFGVFSLSEWEPIGGFSLLETWQQSANSTTCNWWSGGNPLRKVRDWNFQKVNGYNGLGIGNMTNNIGDKQRRWDDSSKNDDRHLEHWDGVMKPP